MLVISGLDRWICAPVICIKEDNYNEICFLWRVDEGPRRYRNYNVGKQQAKVEDLTDEETFHLRTLVTSALGEMKTSPGADTKSAREQKVGGQSFQIEVDRNEGQANKQQRPVEFQDDPLCRVFANLEALSLQRVLLVMAVSAPCSPRAVGHNSTQL